MKTVLQLQTERSQVLAKAEEILDLVDTDDRPMTEDEESGYNLAIERAAKLQIDIEQRIKLEDAQAVSMQVNTRKAEPTGEGGEGGIPASMKATIREGEGEQHIFVPRSYGKMVAFPKTQQGEMRAYRAGMFIRSALFGDVKATDWCRQNGVGVRSALAGGVATAGGVLVPEELESAIIDLREQYGVFRRSCRVTPMGSDTKIVPRRTGGLTAYYVGENTAGTESDASWDNVSLVAKKLMILTRMSSEINEDAVIDLADTMAQEIAYGFALKEDTVGFTGTGIGTDGGITGVLVKAIDGNHGMAVVEAGAAIDTLPEITANDLINLMSVIPTYAKAGSAWYCSPTAEEVVFNAIKVAGGGNTRDILSGLDQPRFLGYPIISSDILPDNVSTVYNDEVMLGFGNLGLAATLGDRRGVRIALSEEQYWEEDQIGIKGTMRHDINVHDLGSGTVKSPFAVLIGTT
jgi:HK97 family phage major capsid protein